MSGTIKVMFVCHGNICRSPMSEFIFKDMLKSRGLSDRFAVKSSATSCEEIGNDIYPKAKRALADRGIPYERRQAVRLIREDYLEFDYILAMDGFNISNIMPITGGDPLGKVSKLLSFAGESGDIADPWYTGDFGRTYSDIVRGLEGFLNSIDL